MVDCIFCKIVRGELPCAKLYEDDLVISFLDIGPINPGHALVLPKNHYPTIFDIPTEELKACIDAVQKVARAVFRATGASGMNVLQNNYRSSGQTVDHIHFHMIPRHLRDGFMPNWPAKSCSASEMKAMVEKVKAELEIA
ncbi:MAG: HIT family protein [Acidobacteriota bacterium]